MNFLRLVSKNYFDPFVLTTCGLVNSAMFYYKYNIDGIVVTNHGHKMCYENNHYYFSSEYKSQGGSQFIHYPVLLLPLGISSVPFVAYDVYKNHANNKEYEKSQKSNTKLSCMCGKLQ